MLLAACAPILLAWSSAPTARDLRSMGSRADDAAYYRPLDAFLAPTIPSVPAGDPFARGRWEGAFVAGRFMLHGWGRQLDRRVNPIFYRGGDLPLRPGACRAWLHPQAVGYVALPDAELDHSAIDEAAVIRSRPAYLRAIWRSRHWTYFAVRVSRRCSADRDGSSARTGTSFSLDVRRPGRFVLRVHFSAYWRWLPARARRPAPGGCTALSLSMWAHSA